MGDIQCFCLEWDAVLETLMVLCRGLAPDKLLIRKQTTKKHSNASNFQSVLNFVIYFFETFVYSFFGTFRRESMRQLIAKRIGVESFVEKLENVMKHESYTLAAQKPQLRFESPDNMLFDYEFTTLFKQLESKSEVCRRYEIRSIRKICCKKCWNVETCRFH